MWLYFRLLLVSLVFLIVGCGFINRKITGQVFIATEGGTTYKLSLVKVYVFKRADILETLKRARPLIEKAEQEHSDEERAIRTAEQVDRTKCTELNSEITAQTSKVSEVQSQYDTLGKTIADILAKADADKKASEAEEEDWSKKVDSGMASGNQQELAEGIGTEGKVEADCAALIKNSVIAQSQADGLKAQFTDLGKAKDATVRALQEDVASLAQYSDDLAKQESAKASLAKAYDETESKVLPFEEALNLSSALAATTTDADGYFALSFPRESQQTYLVAQAQRTVGESKEYYFWVVPATQDAISLNNDNLTKCSALADSLAANNQ